MRIDFFIDVLGSGGAQNQILKLAQGFQSRGFNVRVIVYHEKVFYKEFISVNNIDLLILKERNFFSKVFKLRKILNDNKTDVLISFLERPNVIASLASFPFRSWKLILGERSANPNILKSIKLKCFRVLHVFADNVVANSTVNLNMVTTVNPILSKGKCHVIYNIVEEYNVSEKSETNSFFHLIIGASLRDVKNSLGLVKALSLMKRSNLSRLKITWFGDQHNSDSSFVDTLEFVKDNNLERNIEFRPATESFREEMLKANAVGLFSKFEGFPNVICEAMIQGKAILSTPVSDLPLIIPNSEIQLTTSLNAKDIAISLDKLLEADVNEISKLGIENKRIALRFFSKESILDQYQNLFI